MDFGFSKAERTFQLEARAWLKANRPRWQPAEELSPERWIDIRRRWQRKLHSQRYVGLTWPEQYGGRGATASEQLVFNQEMIDVGAPEPMNVIGVGLGGPTINSHGPPEQKARYLHPILAGQENWAQR